MKRFNSLDQIAQHNDESSCYVVYQAMVFDITETLEDMSYVSKRDCGKDITEKLSQDEEHLFFGANAERNIGLLINREPPIPVNIKDDSMFSPLTVTIIGGVLLLGVLTGAVIFFSSKKKSVKKVEIKKNNSKFTKNN